MYQPGSDYAGVDSLQFHADDGGTAPFGGISNTAAANVTVNPLATETATLHLQVTKAEDDAHTTAQMARNDPYHKELYVGVSTSAMRFENVDIPRAARIIDARLRCLVSCTLPCQVNGVIEGEATGNAEAFSGNGRHLCELPRTEASVAWIWEVARYDSWYESPDIRSVIQEIVDRPDWAPGNAVAIIFSSENAPCREIEIFAYDWAGSERSPKLEVTFER